MIKLFVSTYLILCLATFVSGRSNEFTGSLIDNVQDIANIIKNEAYATSFLDAIKVNPTIAIEQALIGLARKNLDTAMTTCQLCKLHGYGCETHYVTNSAGYILQVQRVYKPNNADGPIFREPILLLHGLFVSSSSWVFNGDQSLAFFLADRNKDVWLINQAGTSYSTNHTVLNPYLDLEFWNFTFIDFGLKDLPATIEYIKRKTHYEKITVLGFSEGTLTLLSYLSLNPSGSKNFDLIYLMAPIGYLGYIDGFANIVPRLKLTNSILGSLRIPFPPLLPVVELALDALCTLTATLPICLELFNSISGFDTPQFPISRLVNFASQVDRTSIKNGVHFLQSINYDHVRLYDHGKIKNLLEYGSETPPALPYHLVDTTRLILISALNDFLAKKENVQKLRNSLTGKPLDDHVVTFPTWGHFDYVTGKEANKYVNEIIYKMYEKYSENAKGMNRRQN